MRRDRWTLVAAGFAAISLVAGLLHFSVRSAANHLMTLGIWRRVTSRYKENTKFYQIRHFAGFSVMRELIFIN
jgi:hypothetical protein